MYLETSKNGDILFLEYTSSIQQTVFKRIHDIMQRVKTAQSWENLKSRRERVHY